MAEYSFTPVAGGAPGEALLADAPVDSARRI